MQKKKINDEIARYQNWVINTNHNSVHDAAKIEQENRQRTNLISKKIAERQNYIGSFAGKQSALNTIKQIFRKQKQNEKKMRIAMKEQQEREALDLMDLGFASQV